MSKPSGLHIYHLIERRFHGVLRATPRQMLCIVLTPEERRRFDSAWDAELPRRCAHENVEPRHVLQAARTIYANYPALLEALGIK